MKTKMAETVTSNEDLVRMRIYDGDLSLDDSGRELIRLYQEQHKHLMVRLSEAVARAVSAERRAVALPIKWSEEVRDGELRISAYHPGLNHSFAKSVSLVGTAKSEAKAAIVSHLEQKFADKLAGG